MALDKDLSPAGGATFALSPQQERLWLLGAEQPRYCARAAVALSGVVDVDRLARALGRITARHEILRTTFVQQRGLRVASQFVHVQLAPSLESSTRIGSRRSLFEELTDDVVDAFPLEHGPVVRARLISSSETEHVLVLTLPAVCADRTSLLILVRELANHYSENPPATEPLQYADYAEWRRELVAAHDDEAKNAQAFWRAREASRDAAPVLFGRFLASAGGADPVGRIPIELDDGSIERIERQCDELRASASTFFEACWHALVARLSGESDVAIAAAVDGRVHDELVDAMGPLTQLATVMTRIEPETSFAEVLDQVRRSRAELARWQDYQPARSEADARIPFAFDALEGSVPMLGDASVSELCVSASIEPVELQLVLHDLGTEWRLELEYDGAVYDPHDVQRIAGMFATLVAGVVTEPDAPAASLPLLAAEERRRLVDSAQGPGLAVAGASIQRLFEEQVDRAPDRPAVVAAESSLGYGELDVAANRLAHHLRSLGVGRDVPVGLCLDRSTDLIVALLGILKAGGAYVPLNDEHPPVRLEQQLGQAGATVVVTQERFEDNFASFDGTIVCVDRDRDAIAAAPGERVDPVTEPDDLVYVMYTSGSTGAPKGVEVTHRNLVNYTSHMIKKLEADTEEGLQFALVSAISTDLGNTCVFPALASGGTLHLIPPDATIDGTLLARYFADRPIDVVKIAPTHLEALLAAVEPERILPRRWLVLGGEASRWALVELMAGKGTCRILNHYGPTETTVGSCTFDVGTEVSAFDPRSVPIGRPVANTSAYVIDTRLEPVPPGVAGELFLGGAGVARGYIGQPEQTGERFVSDPFASRPGAKMYRTGDRVRMLGDGNIEFLGRVDDQVKIRGFRVEPAEIEVALAAHPAVRQAAVVPISEEQTVVRLVAYLLPVAAHAEVGRPSVEELRAHLLASLPDFMVPSDYAFLDAFPLTPSGKVDRIALRETTALEAAWEAAYVAPRDETEEGVARIWAELLGVERVGAFDDFFALGGNSLMATQVIMRLRRTFADVPLQAMFIAPTVAGLAEAIRAGSNGDL